MTINIEVRVPRIVQLLCAIVQPQADKFPATSAAVTQLTLAADIECNRKSKPKRKRKRRAVKKAKSECLPLKKFKSVDTSYDLDAAKIWRQRAYRLQCKYLATLNDLRDHQRSKTVDGRLSQEWIVRVIACAPHASARALADAFHLAAGSDARLVSRASIASIRDAWTEMLQRMVLQNSREAFASHMAAQRESGQPMACVHVVHVQDEAELRVLSGERREGSSVPRRGRTSKIQINVVDVWVEQVRYHVPTELQALGDKTAATLATCFEALVRWIADNVVVPGVPATGGAVPATGGAGPATGGEVETFFVHIMIGDGIATNAAAAKLLMACLRQQPLPPGIRYLLILVKCGNHQVALTAKYCVIGAPAKSAAGDGSAHESVTATAVRLFKYAMPCYYEEFVRSTREWVMANVDALPPMLASQPQAAKLQRLYGERVVPDFLIAHVGKVLAMTLATRAIVASEMFTFAVTKLLRNDEHPTLSRFFTFREVIDIMLCMHLLAMPQAAFVVSGVAPRMEDQQRFKKNAVFRKHTLHAGLASGVLSPPAHRRSRSNHGLEAKSLRRANCCTHRQWRGASVRFRTVGPHPICHAAG